MQQSSNMKAYLAKAVRVVLVFALVFWCSFRAEALAFAQMQHVTVGTVEDHAADTLTDFAVYEVAPDADDGDAAEGGRGDEGGEAEGGDGKGVGDDTDKENATGLGELMAKASDAGKKTGAADGEAGKAVEKLTFEKPGETRDFVAIPSWKGQGFAIDEDEGVVEIANFVEWGLDFEEDEDGDDIECATMKASKDNPGYITIASTQAGTVTVTCGLTSAAQKGLTIDEGLDPDAKASFAVEIREDEEGGQGEKDEEGEEESAEESYSVSVLICDEKGNKLAVNEGQLMLPKEALGKPYHLDAEVGVTTIAADNAETSVTYQNMADARKAGVKITWSPITETDGATIDPTTGVLTFTKADSITVNVEAKLVGETRADGTVPEWSDNATATITVEGASDEPGPGGDEPAPGDDEPGPGGDEPAPDQKQEVDQGASNPQATLTITSNARVPKADAAKDGDEPLPDSEPAADSLEQTEPLEKTYTLAQLKELGSDRATYTMYDSASFVTVTGEGPDLVAVLHDAGITDTSQIEAITFENANGAKTTLTWAELNSAVRYYPHAAENSFEDVVEVVPKLATSSLVRGYGDGTGQGEDTPNAAKGENSTDTGEGGTSADSASSSSSASESAEGSSAASSAQGAEGSGAAAGAEGAEGAEGAAGAEDPDAAEGAGGAEGPDAASASSSSSASSTASTSSSSSASASSSSSSSSNSDAPSTPAEPVTPREVTDDVELLDNTNFRVLFGSTEPPRELADPDALCWVNKISVDVKPTESPDPDPDPDPGYETDLGVSVQYIPAPIGQPAFFSATPSNNIGNTRFDFQWEVSKDNGKTWSDVSNGNVQVLKVTTTEKRIGNQYRVVMKTNATDAKGRANVEVVSDPVTMIEGKDFSVVLEYDPPVAGEVAYFKAKLYGDKKGVDVTYTWQQSQDLEHWTDIPGRHSKTLAVPTEPIDPTAETTPTDEVVPITYIRVIATETEGQKRTAISEAVSLTVHVPEENPEKDKDKGKQKDEPREIPVIKYEDPVDETPLEDDEIPIPEEDRTTVPMEDGTENQQIEEAPPLYINESVTEKVNEQQQAVEQYIESNVPGARWTSLSTVNPTGDDVKNVLADNPFAPLVIPTGLGITVVGGLEKLLFFRRQTK